MRNSAKARSVLLRRGGSSLLLAFDAGPPRCIHWGRDLGELSEADRDLVVRSAEPPIYESSTDVPRHYALLPAAADGWSGMPGLLAHATDGTVPDRPRLEAVEHHEASVSIQIQCDPLLITLKYELDASGVLLTHADVQLDELATQNWWVDELNILLPLPERADEILDLTGEWCGERRPQRGLLRDGVHMRSARRGRPGHDNPLLLVAGGRGFGFRHGEVWAAHVAWSGDQRLVAERLPEGAGGHAASIGGGALLAPGAVRLEPGARLRSPDVCFTWSDAGLDGLSRSLHSYVRSMPNAPVRPRPVTLNTWEAIYFDHDIARLRELAQLSAELGIERFVLDDGWFLGRRDPTTGLGDWTPDPDLWPRGLAEISDFVHELGLEFGLWFEPEMVNPRSRLARHHPDWLLGPPGGGGAAWRHQFALDISRAEVRSYLLEAMSRVITETQADFVKWDHNRDVHEPLGANRRMSGDRQVLGFYALLDGLRERFPSLEIESCASGGGRVDLGVLQRTHRVWASDCNDPVERQLIQRWTTLLIPPERMGTHVGPERAHTTFRRTDLSFRLATALFGHAGLELDISACGTGEREAIAAWIRAYKEQRTLISTGETVRADLPDDDCLLHGIVAQDRSEALYSWVRLGSGNLHKPRRVPLDGLTPDRRYRIRPRTEFGSPLRFHATDPTWLQDGITLPGALLEGVGLQMPALAPQQALVFHAVAQ